MDPRHRSLRLCRRRPRPAPAGATATACAVTAARPRASACRRRRGGARATRSSAPGSTAALDGVEVAYYLIHSMEGRGHGFADLERRAAEQLRRRGRRRRRAPDRLPRRAGPRRRAALAPPRVAARGRGALLAAAPESIALRASIVIGARSRSFRFLVRLIERMPVMALPAWRDNRTAPVDGRDMLEFLAPRPTRAGGARGPVVGHRGPGRDELRGDDRADRRRHAGPPAPRRHRCDDDGDRVGRGGRDRRRGPRL